MCSSNKIINKGTITKNKQNIFGKSVEFKEQQYQYKFKPIKIFSLKAYYCNMFMKLKNIYHFFIITQ